MVSDIRATVQGQWRGGNSCLWPCRLILNRPVMAAAITNSKILGKNIHQWHDRKQREKNIC